jgi:hypothetical protein
LEFANPPVTCADTVTRLDVQHRGKVLIGGSHGGKYAGYLAAKAGVRAVILHDAGVGKDSAGIGSLAYLDNLGIPAATVDYRTARIADGKDQLARGIISHVNKIASALDCRVGQSCTSCSEQMTFAREWSGEVPPFGESRFLLKQYNNRVGLNIWGIDSVSLLNDSDKNQVVITASHGGVLGGGQSDSIIGPPLAVAFNDAGIGADESGIASLPVLEREGVMAVTVGHLTARIGDARSAWDSGKVSRVNLLAKAAGILPGDDLPTFAEKSSVTADRLGLREPTTDF